ADDLVQEACVRAFRFWKSFRPGTSVRAWLVTIVRNTFINRYHRERRRRRNRDAVAAAGRVVDHDPFAGKLPAPDRAAEAERLRRRILAALDLLPEDYRLAVTLADLEGFSYREIAEAMECPIGTVMSRIHRGRKMLRNLLAEEAEELGIVVPPKPPPEADAATGDDAPVKLADYRRRGTP
ncbi:MAG: sigma-70 family RNA polymerase sigma factor, partial [Deltaproteobacteria bacterium]